MQNTTDTPVLEKPEVDTSVQAEATTDVAAEVPATEPLSDEELLKTLQDRLNNGTFPVELSPRTLKNVRSFLQEKAKFKGHEEAMYVATAAFIVESLVGRMGHVPAKETEKVQTIQFPALTIKILCFFLSRHEGTGYTAVERYLAMSAPLNQALSKVQSTEQEVKRLEDALNPAQPEDPGTPQTNG